MLVVVTLLSLSIAFIIKIDNPQNIAIGDVIGVLSMTVTLVTIYGFLFNRYMWHWCIFTWAQWFVKVPYLAGEWDGTLKYYWDGEWREKPMTISIRQTFLHIQVFVKTDESWSKTIGGSFDVDEENGFNSLIYSYINTPDASVRERSPIHYGTAILSIEKDFCTLRGNYFTDRKSSGEMILTKKENKCQQQQ